MEFQILLFNIGIYKRGQNASSEQKHGYHVLKVHNEFK